MYTFLFFKLHIRPECHSTIFCAAVKLTLIFTNIIIYWKLRFQTTNGKIYKMLSILRQSYL